LKKPVAVTSKLVSDRAVNVQGAGFDGRFIWLSVEVESNEKAMSIGSSLHNTVLPTATSGAAGGPVRTITSAVSVVEKQELVLVKEMVPDSPAVN
jgi:hypothetical protein